MKRDQASVLREKFSQNSTSHRPTNTELPVRTISFTSGKGGVGKTSVVVNLAIQLTMMGKNVFVIDADLGLANIDIMLNLTPQFTIEDVLSGQKGINDIIQKGPLGFHILPSSSGLSEMQELTAAQQMAMFRELSGLKTKYDYILIDTGAGIASNVLRFNAAADEICVVTNTEPTAMTDAYALMKAICIKYQVHHFNLIVNQANLEGAKSVYSRLTNVANQFLSVNLTLIGYIPRDPLFSKAIISQTPISLLAPGSRSVKMIKKMANHMNYHMEQSIHTPPLPFWQRISRWRRQ